MMPNDASFFFFLGGEGGVAVAAQVLSIPCLMPTQVEHEEFQQESVLKQLEVLQEEDKEYQHIKV